MREWAWNAELEDAIRENPDDDGAWSVYEDWILDGPFPALRRLDIDLRTLEVRAGDPVPAMARLLAGGVAPQLETLDLICADYTLTAFHKRLKTSVLGKTLRVLEHQRVPTAWSPA